jgi:hypothetical protein
MAPSLVAAEELCKGERNLTCQTYTCQTNCAVLQLHDIDLWICKKLTLLPYLLDWGIGLGVLLL